MRDRKEPDDEYNRRLHIYAETPGLQQAHLVPASEKELNTPPPQPPTSSTPTRNGHSSLQTNPYARIPAANLVEEEEEDDGGVPMSQSVTGGASTSSSSKPTSSSLSPETKLDVHIDRKTFAPKRDPIYAELDHRNSEDDRTENDGAGAEQNSSGLTTQQTPSSRTSESIPTSSQGTNDEPSRKLPPLPSSKRPAPLPGSSIAKKLDLSRGSGPNTKTIRTHTRLDASLEIPATRRPKPRGIDATDDGGRIQLIKKTELNPAVGPQTSSTSERGNDAETNRSETSGIILTHIRSIDGQTTVTKINKDGETQSTMPVEPDLDLGVAIIKKKRRFRRNMIFIISFLMILLVVVAAVIISLVIVTKAERFW